MARKESEKSQKPQNQQISLYGGEVVLEFDEERHRYTRRLADGTAKKVEGVTSILQILSKPLLIPWAAKMVAEKILRTMPIISDRSGIYTKEIRIDQFRRLVESARHAHREKLESAGDIGTQAHGVIEGEILSAIANNGGVVDSSGLYLDFEDIRVANCVRAAVKWMDAHAVRWLHTEKIVYSRMNDYAGTMDGLCHVSSCCDPACCPAKFSEVLSIADWKSSGALYPEYAYQVAAYEKAYEEETGQAVADRWILRLGKETGDFEPWHRRAEDFHDDFWQFAVCIMLSRGHKSASEQLAAVIAEREIRIADEWFKAETA